MREFTTDDGHVITVRRLSSGAHDVQLHNATGETTATVRIPPGGLIPNRCATARRLGVVDLAALLMRGPRRAHS